MSGIAYRLPTPPDEDDAEADQEYGHRQRPCAVSPEPAADSSSVHADAHPGVGSQILGQLQESHDICASFDGKYEAFVENYNVFIKPKGDQPAYPISFDGSEGNYYTLSSFAWSPDSKKLVAYHTRPGYDRLVTISSRLRPTRSSRRTCDDHYRSPATRSILLIPSLFDIATKQADGDRSRAVPERVRFSRRRGGRTAGLHVRVQPARTPALSRDRSGCADGRCARADRRREQDIRLITAARARALRRQASSATISTMARRSSGCRSATAGSTSISTTAHRHGEEPDHQGRLAGAQRRLRRRGEAADLVRGRRHASRAGSVLHAVLPHQLRRHRPDATDRCRRHAHGRPSRPTASFMSIPGRE